VEVIFDEEVLPIIPGKDKIVHINNAAEAVVVSSVVEEISEEEAEEDLFLNRLNKFSNSHSNPL
jgi:hypothetical protein